jgi:hypothetical protein
MDKPPIFRSGTFAQALAKAVDAEARRLDPSEEMRTAIEQSPIRHD